MSKKTSTTLANLRNIVRKEVVQQLKEDIGADKAVPMHVLVNKITKAAGDGIKSLEHLKNREMPTQKAVHAIESSVQALEHIFNDMLRNPTAYLDQGDPNEIVSQHREKLAGQEQALSSGGNSGEPPTF
jgi:ribosomal protein S25